MVHQLRPVGQAVKTPPSHGGITSSSLVRVTIFLLAGVYGKEVPPVPFPNTEVKLFYAYDTWSSRSGKIGQCRHKSTCKCALRYSSIAQSVEHAAVNRRVVGSSPTGGAKISESRKWFAFLFYIRWIEKSPIQFAFAVKTESGFFLYTDKTKTAAMSCDGFSIWQGHQESNSGHVVLETTALPAELYPYENCFVQETCNINYYSTKKPPCQLLFAIFFIWHLYTSYIYPKMYGIPAESGQKRGKLRHDSDKSRQQNLI